MSQLQEMENLMEQLAATKQALEEISAKEKEIQETRRAIENEIMRKLKEVGNTSYRSKFGLATIKTTFSYKIPKDLQAKEQLFNYIKEKGHDVYLSLLSVNSQTLNAWAKQELQNAIDNGKFPFSIPGLDEPIPYETISFRKG